MGKLIRIFIKLLLTGLLGHCSLLFASINSDLENIFSDLGEYSNFTQGQYYNGQRAGFYSGGSLFSRNRVRDYNLMHVNLPSIKSGWGGIDLFTGGFSFINSKELVNVFKNIANNAVSYSFLLGLETVSPLIKNQMVELQTKMDAINRLNINSCQTSSLLVGSLWPKTEEASRTVCESIGSSHNFFSDRVAARHGCVDSASRSKIMQAGRQDKAWQDFIVEDVNVAWQAILKNEFYAKDKELSSLLLSLSGSLIVTKDNITVLPSLSAYSNDVDQEILDVDRCLSWLC